MIRIRSILLWLSLCVPLSACVSSRSFVDTSYPKLGYEQLKKTPEPLQLKLYTEFQRNGEHLSRADQALYREAEMVLRSSGLIVPLANEGAGDIKVTVNNIVDLAEARAKGVGIGLTFGAAGSVVTDAYEMSVLIKANGKVVERTGIKHALHSAIGNTSLPEGVETMPANVAFGRVVEQMLLRTLQDMQQKGDLP